MNKFARVIIIFLIVALIVAVIVGVVSRSQNDGNATGTTTTTPGGFGTTSTTPSGTGTTSTTTSTTLPPDLSAPEIIGEYSDGSNIVFTIEDCTDQGIVTATYEQIIQNDLPFGRSFCFTKCRRHNLLSQFRCGGQSLPPQGLCGRMWSG